MKLTFFCTLASALMMMAQAHLFCNCGLGKGKDQCVAKPHCAPLVIRPQPLHKMTYSCKPKIVCKEVKPAINPLSPIGDLCTCTKTIVKPAIVPKPACGGCAKSDCHHCQSSSTSHHKEESHHHHEDFHHDSVHSVANNHYHHDHHGPADPVSIQIALALQNQANQPCVTESSLAFGFRSMPKDADKKNPRRITEEDLNNLKGEIVELKPVPVHCGKTLEEEAEEDLHHLADEEQHHMQEEADIKQLSYGEIGYGPAKIQHGNFVKVAGSSGSSGAAASASSTSTGVGFAQSECTSGFVPGQVIVKQIPNGQALETSAGTNCKLFESDEEDEDDEARHPLGYPTFKYTSSAAHASCSSHHHNSKSSSAFFEKLGCSH